MNKKRSFALLLALVMMFCVFMPSANIFAYDDVSSDETILNSDPIMIPNFVYHHGTYITDDPYIYVRTGYGNYSSTYHGWLALDWAKTLAAGHNVYVGTLYRIDYNNGNIPGPTKKLPEEDLFELGLVD